MINQIYVMIFTCDLFVLHKLHMGEDVASILCVSLLASIVSGIFILLVSAL